MLIRHFTAQRDRPAALAAALVAAFLLAATAAEAVEQTGELQGLVRDEHDQPLPGVLVNLKGTSLQGERAVPTDAEGRFAFRGLPPGPYVLTYSAPGYQTIEQEGIVVAVGRTTSLRVDLNPGETENITVVGSVPLVDTVRTTTQDNYTAEYLESTQVGSAGRNYLSVIANSAGTGPGVGGNFTVRGATIGENLYLVDGVDSTDPVTATFGTNFIYDAIQEVQVQTGGFAAEFGRATGGIVNVVTKSGGNDFAGSVDLRFRNQDFIEKGDHLDPSAFKQERRVGEATFGGPIVKDKLWFFLAGQNVSSDAQPAGSPSLFSFNGNYYLGKLTWQVNPAHRLSLQVTGDPAEIDNVDAGPLIAKEATTFQKQGSKFATVQWQAAFTPDVLLQAQVSTYASTLDATPQSGDLDTIGRQNFFTGEQTVNALNAQFSDRNRDQVNATLSWHVGRAAGEHLVKVGADVQALKFEFESFTPGGEFDNTAPDANGIETPLLYNVDVPAGRLDNAGRVSGYFAQDEWRITPRLTVNAGLRYDTYSYDDDRGREVIRADLLQPRLGVAWNVTADARNVVKAYGGVFAHPSLLALPRVVNSRAAATDLFVNEEIACWIFCQNAGPTPLDVNGDGLIEPRVFFARFGGPGGSEIAHGGDLDATNVLEVALGYERQFSPRTAAGLTLVQRKTRDIIEDSQDPVTGVFVVDNLRDAKRRHVGAELRFQTAFAGMHLWSSYSYGVSRGNIEYTQSLGSDFDFNAVRTNRYGYLTDDARHTLRVNGYLDLPLAFQIGYAYQYSTGFPVNRTELAFPFGEKFIRERGYLRLPAVSQLDLDLRRSFSVGGTRLTGIVSVTNVLDREGVTAVNRFDPDLQANGFQAPRRYEVGVRYKF